MLLKLFIEQAKGKNKDLILIPQVNELTIIETNRNVQLANEKMFIEWLVNDKTEFEVSQEEFIKMKFYSKAMIN